MVVIKARWNDNLELVSGSSRLAEVWSSDGEVWDVWVGGPDTGDTRNTLADARFLAEEYVQDYFAQFDPPMTLKVQR